MLPNVLTITLVMQGFSCFSIATFTVPPEAYCQISEYSLTICFMSELKSVAVVKRHVYIGI